MDQADGAGGITVPLLLQRLQSSLQPRLRVHTSRMPQTAARHSAVPLVYHSEANSTTLWRQSAVGASTRRRVRSAL